MIMESSVLIIDVNRPLEMTELEHANYLIFYYLVNTKLTSTVSLFLPSP
jgi:hypothetical protein